MENYHLPKLSGTRGKRKGNNRFVDKKNERRGKKKIMKKGGKNWEDVKQGGENNIKILKA